MLANLSGGNQQKVILARWLGADPIVLLLADPTRGVDIATKQEIYRIIRAEADKGVAVLILSTELTELLGLCDRVLGDGRGHDRRRVCQRRADGRSSHERGSRRRSGESRNMSNRCERVSASERAASHGLRGRGTQ